MCVDQHTNVLWRERAITLRGSCANLFPHSFPAPLSLLATPPTRETRETWWNCNKIARQKVCVLCPALRGFCDEATQRLIYKHYEQTNFASEGK